MDKSDIKALFSRYKKGQCTPEEVQLLHKWLIEGSFDPSELSDEEMLDDLKQLEVSLPFKQVRTTYPLHRVIAYVASLLLILGVSYYTYNEFYAGSEQSQQRSELTSLDPGYKKAILKLSDGSALHLDTLGKDKIIEIDGSTVQLNSAGQLVYLPEHGNSSVKNHQIITPNGGQYEIILPDGTHVWLNSSSKISFTNTFKQLPERRIELEGEAYFKVSRDVDHPFVVTFRGQEIKVLGTEFNVNAYVENDYVKASLVEGSVLFNRELLQPGQSATYQNNSTTIHQENIDDIVAWKNGYFVFFEETLEEAMLKVSRWYDLEVLFADRETQSILLGGSISKYEDAREVFKMMEKAGGVKIEVNNRQVTVTKSQTK